MTADSRQPPNGHEKAAEPLGLYLHIPFCVKKCPYCDFVSGPVGLSLRRQHLAALELEIRRSPWAGSRVRTVFLGGGTPSELNLSELEALVQALRDSFDLTPVQEWTIECNPGTVRPAKLEGFRRLGINRVSLGVQSFQDVHLRTLGRVHGVGEARQAIHWTRQAGFDNLNLDLIFAVPGQTLAQWRRDLDEALSFRPEHLSLYNLTFEAGTEFAELRARGELAEVDPDLAADMFELAMDRTAAAGWRQYEISNYALPGRECLHNLVYWKNQPYLGFGLSAASYVDGLRWNNTDDFTGYAAGVAGSGSPPRQTEERLQGRSAVAEAVMLGLRTVEGADLAGIGQLHRFPAADVYRDTLAFLESQGLVARQNERLTLTRRGKLLASSVCAEFF